ncbi:MAG: DUF2203 family protein [Dehalococcoidia bacterium]|nr:DUF2203 family protein [Dehalococcoidia bacterium]
MPRLFSIEEANALIPYLEEAMRRALDIRVELDRFSEEAAAIAARATGNGHAGHGEMDAKQKAAQEAAARLEALATEVRDHGCELKDIRRGLTDFPHERNGQVVYLCWMLGEQTITHWHEIEAGFSGRQPL